MCCSNDNGAYYDCDRYQNKAAYKRSIYFYDDIVWCSDYADCSPISYVFWIFCALTKETPNQ